MGLDEEDAGQRRFNGFLAQPAAYADLAGGSFGDGQLERWLEPFSDSGPMLRSSACNTCLSATSSTTSRPSPGLSAGGTLTVSSSLSLVWKPAVACGVGGAATACCPTGLRRSRATMPAVTTAANPMGTQGKYQR